MLILHLSSCISLEQLLAHRLRVRWRWNNGHRFLYCWATMYAHNKTNPAAVAHACNTPFTLLFLHHLACSQTKPHGHGDVHALLHSSGLAKKWQAEGFKWVCFFQVSCVCELVCGEGE